MFNPIASSSANKEKIVNENFLFQEAFNFGVIDRSLSSPPVNPSSQGVYIPAVTATGAWAGKENQLLWWNPDGYWRAIAPKEGMKLFTQIEGEIAIEYLGRVWQAIAISSGGTGTGYGYGYGYGTGYGTGYGYGYGYGYGSSVL